MKDERKTKKQLADELAESRQRVAELEAAETERKRAEKELVARERYLARLSAITRAALETPDLPTMLQTLADRLGELLDADGCYITLWDKAQQMTIPAAAYGELREEYPTLCPEPGEVTMTESVLRSGHPIAVKDVFDTPYLSPRIAALFPARSLLALPLTAGDQKLGAALIAFNQPHRFTPDEIARGEQAAGQIALAVAKAQLVHSLRESEERFRDMALSISDWVWEVDSQGRYLYCSERVVDVLGYTAEEILGKTPFDLMPPDEATRVGSIFEEITKNREPIVDLENWNISREGREVCLLTNGAPIFDRDGSYVGYRGVDKDITERKRAEEALRWERDLAEALGEATAALTATLDLEQVLDRILEQVSRIVPGDATNIMLIEGDEARIVRWRGYERFGAEEFVSKVVFRITEVPNLQHMLESGEPIIIPDTAAYPGWVSAPVLEWLRSYAAVPIVARGEVLGFLNVDSATSGFFTQAHLGLLRAFASQAAITIENARLFQHACVHAEEQAVLNELGQALTARLDVGQVLDAAYRGASCLVDTANFYIVLYNPDKDEITFALDVVDGEVQEPNIVWQAGQGLAEHVIRSRTPLLIKENLPERLREMGIGLLGRPALSWVGVPLVIGDRVLGMMAAVQSDAAARTYDEHDRDLLTSIASQVAIALQNARLFQETQRRITQLMLINDVGGKIAAVLDLDSVLDRTVRLVQESFGYHHVAIFTLNCERDELVMRTRVGDFAHLFPPDHRLKLGQGLVGWAGYYGKSLLVNDVDAEPRYVNLYPDLIPTRSELSVPIGVGGEVVGVLDVQSPQLNAFDENDVMVIETVADQVAIAIENARLHGKVIDHAELLEQRVRERTAQLAAERARLEAILHSTADGIVVTDAEGEVLRANPVARTWLTQTLSLEDTGQLQEMIRSVAIRAEKRSVELLELTGLDLELSGAPILEPEMEEALRPDFGELSRAAQGQPAAVVDIHDVSHMKALDRMKTRFVTNISHELRTPITTIKLYAHLMGQQPEKWEKYLPPLAEEADRQAQLVAGILEISDIDAGRLEMDPRPTPLDELAEVSVAGRQVMAQDKGLTLEHRTPPPSPPRKRGRGGVVALVDPERMMQVLYNLVENAIHYTPEGGKVVVSTGKQEAGGRVWATVTVEDTGMGIPEEELPHIFDRFYRGVEPRAMQISGTGLGLAIVEEIVELHGGRVTVESEEDVGSTFTVWLPLSE